MTAHCVQKSPQYGVWGNAAWSTKEDYLTNGFLTGTRIWYAVSTQHANYILG